MNCNEIKNIAFELSIRNNANALTPDFENHLADCQECNSYFKFHKAIFQKAKQDVEETKVNPFISTQILNRHGLIYANISRLKWYFQPILALLILVFAVGTGIILGKENSFLYSHSSIKSVEKTNEYSEYITYVNNEQFEQQYFNLMDYE